MVNSVNSLRQSRSIATQRTLNFLLVGQNRAGLGIVQSAISNQPGAVCHAALLEGTLAQRRALHEAYFGACPTANEQHPVHFVEVLSNPIQYITHTVFDNPQRGEQVIGLRVGYQALRKLDLFEHVEEFCRAGDFCLIHVQRNPVCCYVSYRQAEASGLWQRLASNPTQVTVPWPVRVDPTELISYCREALSVEHKIRRLCDDALVVRYRDLCLSYDRTMGRIMQFLELNCDRVPQPDSRRLRNFDMKSRVSNWVSLKKEVPSDVRDLMKEEELY